MFIAGKGRITPGTTNGIHLYVVYTSPSFQFHHFLMWPSTIIYTFPFMNLGNRESPVHLTCISLDREERLKPPGETHTGEESVQPPHREGGPLSPSWGFVSVRWRKALATFDIMFSADHGWGQKQYIIFLFLFFPSFLFQWQNSATECLVTVCLLFIINQYAFNLSDPGNEAFQSKFKTLCVCSVLDI